MYKLIQNVDMIIRLTDNTFIPVNPDNTDYKNYLKWLEEGNTPEPADVVEPAKTSEK